MLWLYDENEIDFKYNGIVLNNAYDADIHWVLNSTYKLTFKYPTVDNEMYALIEKGMIVKADEHDRKNLFRIKDIDINEHEQSITVTAYQKTFDYSKRLVKNFSKINSTCQTVLDEWVANFVSTEKDFSWFSDIKEPNSFITYKDEKDTSLKSSFDLFGKIADTFNGDIDMHNNRISILKKLGRDTEEVLTTAKNITSFVTSSNADDIVTRLYVTSTFRVGDKEDKEKLKEKHRLEMQALRDSQKKYSKESNDKLKAQQMQDEINSRYAREVLKNNRTVKRSGQTFKTYAQIEAEVRAKYQERELKANQRKVASQQAADKRKAEIEALKAKQKEETAALDEEVTINLIVESPLINDYPFINEMSVSNNDLRTAEELEEWAIEHFTKDNIDKPKNSIKVTYEQLSENINRGDTVILKYTKYDIDERIRIVETHYDPIAKRWIEFILGEKESNLGREVSQSSHNAESKANAYTDWVSLEFEKKVKEQSENFEKIFSDKEDELKKKIEDGIETTRAESEVFKSEINDKVQKAISEIEGVDKELLNKLKDKIAETNRIAEATVKMVGTDDSITYGKNRLEGDTTRDLKAGTHFVELTHNGDGFEVGQKYTISWEAVCNVDDFYDIIVKLSRPVNHYVKVSLIDPTGFYDTMSTEYDAGETTKSLLHVYDAHYLFNVESPLFKKQDKEMSVRSASTYIVPMEFKEIGDVLDTNIDIIGKWSEETMYIFDGGGN
jgi:phage minor structural protein, N-terminal domain protein